MNTADIKRVIEALLLCAQQPVPVAELRRLFAEDVEIGADTLRALLDELRIEWQGRGVELVPLASGWRFQTTPDIARFVARLHPERPPRYSRAVLETLAIVAYRQPVTRGDIEEIRGVAVSAQIVKTLEERGWIEVIGHKDVVGRPALFATTRQFLDDLGLRSLQELPSLDAEVPAAEALGQRMMALEADARAAQAEGSAVAIGPGPAGAAAVPTGAASEKAPEPASAPTLEAASEPTSGPASEPTFEPRPAAMTGPACEPTPEPVSDSAPLSAPLSEPAIPAESRPAPDFQPDP